MPSARLSVRGITDHGYGLSIANGVSMSDLKRQHAEIDTLNRGYKAVPNIQRDRGQHPR